MVNKTWIVVLLLSVNANAFEGIVHCTKTQNGVKQSFEMYVRNDKLVVLQSDEFQASMTIVDISKGQMFVCLNYPGIEKKGYYQLFKENNLNDIDVKSKKEILPLISEESSFEGFEVQSSLGLVSVYYSELEVNITGLYSFISDPVYFTLDYLSFNKLPKRIIVESELGDYYLDFEIEETKVDETLFEIPNGYVKYNVGIE